MLEAALLRGCGSRQQKESLALALVEEAAPGLAGSEVQVLCHRLGLKPGTAARAALVKPLVERHGLAPLAALELAGLHRMAFKDMLCHFDRLQGQPALLVIGKALLDRRVLIGDDEDHGPDEHWVRGICEALPDPRMDTAQRIELARHIAAGPSSAPLLDSLFECGIEDLAVQGELAATVGGNNLLFPSYSTTQRLREKLPEPARLGMAMANQSFVLRQQGIAGLQGAFKDLLGLHPRSQGVLFNQVVEWIGGLQPIDEPTRSLPALTRQAMAFCLPQWERIDVDDKEQAAKQQEKLFHQIKEAFGRIDADPQLQRLADAAQSQSSPQVRLGHMEWAFHAALMLGTLDSPRLQGLQDSLSFLNALHAPRLRVDLTVALVLNTRVYGDTAAYARFAAQFRHPRALGFAMALYPLHAQPGVVLSEHLRMFLQHAWFKDHRRLHQTLGNLMHVAAESPDVTPCTVRRLLERALPATGTTAQRGEAFLKNLRLLAIVLQLLQRSEEQSGMRPPGQAEQSREIAETLRAMAQPVSREAITTGLTSIARQLMPGKGAMEQTALHDMFWSNFMGASRQPEALMFYTQTLRNHVHGEDAQDASALLEAIERYGDAVAWSPDPREAFARLRYDTRNSLHLAEIAARSPGTLVAWQRGATLPPAHGLATGPLAQHRVVDTDAAEDFLLCGTEVPSCMGVNHSHIDFNKALLGYALDGKYRMLAVKAQDGAIAARRMLRLLIDNVTQEPVLHLEKLYANAGMKDGSPADQALLDLARHKAREMGCTLLCDEVDTRYAGEPHPHAIVSKGSPAPFEYVDAQLGDVVRGTYKLKATTVKPPDGLAIFEADR